MSQLSMYEGQVLEEEEIDDEEIGEDEMDEDMNEEDMDDEEIDEEFYEAMYISVMAIYALMHVLNQFLIMMRGELVKRPLTRRRITSVGYDYIHQALNDDPAIFRQVYRMYLDVFRKLCTILREKTLLEDTRFICVEEMLASFLQIVGQNTRYCVIQCRSDEFPIEPIDESSSSILQINVEDNLEPIVQTQEQQRENANAWRATIALDMWRDAT
ncbi:hypothetical protein LguiA_011812 [Lonicera macranthoides]